METTAKKVLSWEERDAWGALLSRALASLDEDGGKALDKAREAARRKLEKANMASPPVDMDEVKRVLLRYSRLDSSLLSVVKERRTDRLMLQTAWELWPDARAVRDYLTRMRKLDQAMGNEDMLDSAREGMRRLMTEDGAKLNAQTVMFAAERLDQEHFGPARRKDDSERAPVVYNLPGLTMNLVMAPGEALPAKSATAVEAEVVEAGR